MKTDDGLIILLVFRQTLWKIGLVDSLEKYEDFECVEREDGQSIQSFTSAFDLKYKRIEWKTLKLPTEVLAIMFLK